MYTLLFVDDEENIRRSIVDTVNFEEAGFKLIGECSNGMEALEQVEKYSPDLVLTDVKMPIMSGTELAEAILEIHPSVSVAFLTGCDDFQTAKQAVEFNIAGYILKPVTSVELIEQLKKIKNRMDSRKGELLKGRDSDDLSDNKELKKELLLMSVILLDQNTIDQQSNVEDLKKSLEKLGLVSENNCYTVVLTKMVNGGDKLSVRFVDGIMGKYFSCQSFISGNIVFTLISAPVEDRRKYLSGAVKEISETAERYFGVRTRSGLSESTMTPKHIRRAYREAKTALQSLESGEKQDEEISYISDIENKPKSANNMFIAQVGEYIEQLLKAGSKKEVEDYLHKSFSKAIDKNVDIGLLSMQIMISIYRSITSITDNPPPMDFLENSCYSEVWKNYGASKAQMSVEELCIKAKDFIDEKHKNNADQIGVQAMRIISERFSDPMLTLQQLSEELYCSVPYLSTLIKKQYGSTFVNLLTKKRMERAKQLISGTVMKMSEISERCGYIDQQYFSYSFKKYFGVSPLKARDGGFPSAEGDL